MGTVRAGDNNIFYGKGTENHQLGIEFYVHHRIVSAIKREESVSDRMSYTVLRVRWCKTIIFNTHAENEEKSYDSQDSFLMRN